MLMVKTASNTMVECIEHLILEPVSGAVEHKEGEEFPYSSLIRSFLCLSTHTRLDTTFSAGNSSKFLEILTNALWVVSKCMLHCLQGTQEGRITICVVTSRSRLQSCKFTGLSEYSDSD